MHRNPFEAVLQHVQPTRSRFRATCHLFVSANYFRQYLRCVTCQTRSYDLMISTNQVQRSLIHVRRSPWLPLVMLNEV